MRRFASLLLLFLSACPGDKRGNGDRGIEENAACVRSLNEGKLDDAEIACDHGLEFAPDYADLWNNKGLIEKLRGNKTKAKDDFIHAIRLDQEHAQAYLNLGVMYLEEQDPKAAKQQFERALKVNPDYAEALFNLSLAQRQLGDREGARKSLRTLIHVHPDIAAPNVELGMMSLEDKNAAEALPYLQRAVDLNPREPRGYLYLGVALHELGRNDEAKDAFNLCVDATPDSASDCQRNLQALQQG